MTAWPHTRTAAISLHWRWRLSVGLAALAHGALAWTFAEPDHSPAMAAVELRPAEWVVVEIENEASGARVAEAAEPQSASPAGGAANNCSSTSATRSASKPRLAPAPQAAVALTPQPPLAESTGALVLTQGGDAHDDNGTLHRAGSESRVGARGTLGGGTRAATGEGRGAPGPIAQRPRLRTSGDPCRGLFPFSAHQDSGLVTVAVDVSRTGSPAHAQVVAERPAGEGFGAAARTCATRLAFAPALGANGAPVDARAVVRLKFARN